MSLINEIQIGKHNKQTRQQLMYKAKITNEKQFKKELAELKKQYIIIFDDGYYLPSSKEEYMEFISKMKEQERNINRTIELAYKEMEELENV